METAINRRKTIAEVALELMAREGANSLGWGDTGYLDMIATEASHTSLMKQFPTVRHHSILNALDKSGLFTKKYFLWPGRKGKHRRLYLKPA